MSRNRLLTLVGAAACLLAAIGIAAWTLWPEPPPPTADDVAAAMTRHDPATLPPAQHEQWVGEVATTIDRLPPHEFPKLFQRAMQDPVLRERFHALGPDQQHKLGLLLSEEQFARMVVELSAPMVSFCRRLPGPVRRHVVRQVHRLSKEHAAARGQEMTKENFAHWQKATTPSRRAEFIRSMRLMRQMLDDADAHQ